MRSLLAAILSLFLPPRGAHRAPGVAVFPTACPGVSAHRTRPHPADVILVDGLPLVRPYLAVWERERDARERRQLQRERRRAAVLATLGQDYVPTEAAA
ncbi:hypothetical protein [Streptomyces rishiriensis]|uniref:Uncharacterized protein n=1 Tax=Streptomyces rishiriensis TaxID=68264 RepID=A0ABU0NPR9_STRRH|nr:hypothetical protein [Streptomyces rishiriensis]MDQ0581148.1 hypothetical protein [Streptomyces rishiriensis]